MDNRIDEYEEQRMFYGDYKNYYPGFKTVKGSYDPADKTIVVIVPVVYNNGED